MIQNLRDTEILSKALLNRIIDKLEVPEDANFKLLGTMSKKTNARGIGRDGMLIIPLQSFTTVTNTGGSEGVAESVYAGYSIGTNTLYLANIGKVTIDMPLQPHSGEHGS